VIASVGIILSGKMSGAAVENEIIELDREKNQRGHGAALFLGLRFQGWSQMLVFVEFWAVKAGVGGRHVEKVSSRCAAVSAYQDEWDAVWIAGATGGKILLSPSGVSCGAGDG